MCNRVVQKGNIVKPGERITVLLKGPGAQFEMEFAGAIFGGPAKSENRNYWIKREGAEPVIVPDVSRFGEKKKPRANKAGKMSRPAPRCKDSSCRNRPEKIIAS